MSEVTTEPMDALTLRVAADAIVLLHLAFILWVGLGGLLIGRWPWLAGLHLPAVAWGVFIEVTGGVCPLTPWENALRHGAGEAGYAGGFIDHYVLPLIYPTGLTREVQFLIGAGVWALNSILYGRWLLRYWRRGGSGHKKR
jgi:hypothetical protein